MRFLFIRSTDFHKVTMIVPFIMAKLGRYGVQVLSAKENISDDARGVLIESILQGIAGYYSVELAQKIRREMQFSQ